MLPIYVLSEFPSLSGSSQPQYQPPSQAIWQRNAQQTPVQRPQQPQAQLIQSAQDSQQQQAIQQRLDISSQDNDDMFTGSTHLQNALNDYRQDGQNPPQSSGTRQPPTTNIEDFPPLGRNGTSDSLPDQRNPFATFSNSNAFSSQQAQNQIQPTRSGLSSGLDTQANDTRSIPGVSRLMSPGGFPTTSNSRSPLENGRPSVQDPGRDVRMNSTLKFHALMHNKGFYNDRNFKSKFRSRSHTTGQRK